MRKERFLGLLDITMMSSTSGLQAFHLRQAKKDRLKKKLAAARQARATNATYGDAQLTGGAARTQAESGEPSARGESCDTQVSSGVAATRESQGDTLPDAFVSRRVVDFGVMRDRVLKGCDVCGRRLDVWKHCVGERRVGLASELHVECSRCGAVNDVATSKSHAVKRRSMSDVIRS